MQSVIEEFGAIATIPVAKMAGSITRQPVAYSMT